MSSLSTSQLHLRAAHIRLPFRDSFPSSAQGRPQLRGDIPWPARHSSSLAIAAYSNEMFRALATHLTNNDVDAVVPAAMSTLPGFVSSRLWFLLKLLLFHPTGRQREHHSPLLRAAQLLSKGEEMPSLAAIAFRSHETPHGLGKKILRRVTEHHNRLMTTVAFCGSR